MIYPFTTDKVMANNHTFWIASCPALKGCVGQGDTVEEAVAELEENEHAWLETAKEFGIPIPPVPVKVIDFSSLVQSDHLSYAFG